MTRYATPLAFKAALEERLKRQAQATGRDLNRFRQLFLFERFLARVFQMLGNQAMLKGAFGLELRLERARTTRDIDLRLLGSADHVHAQLQQLGRLDLGDYLSFQVERGDPLTVLTSPYDGIRFKVTPQLGGRIYGSRFPIDVMLACPQVGEPEEIRRESFLAFAGAEPVTFWVIPLETHLAEKLHAYTFPRETNSRLKDLPDLALMARSSSFDGASLRSVIDQVFEQRATHSRPEQLPAPPSAWQASYEEMASEEDLPWQTLGQLYIELQSFLDPVLAAATMDKTWQPVTWTWMRVEAARDS